MTPYLFLIMAVMRLMFINADKSTINNQDSIPLTLTAGDLKILNFAEAKATSRVLLKNAYGKTIISPTAENVHIFQVPAFISEKSGILYWQLLNAVENRSGEIKITAQDEPQIIENYFGPRSIQAGDNDYSMLVSIPTDQLDNPLIDGTKVEISEYFQGNLKETSIAMQHMFAYKNVYTKHKAKNITVSSSSKGLHAKEMISQIYPSTAIDFNINIRREHEYADGNQVVDIVTSQLEDAYGNVVSDGTLVEFVIENAEKMKLKSLASTISGVATAKVLHPEQPDIWNLSANVTGMAETDTISLAFKSVLKEFKVVLNKEQQKIMVGPLESFMGQWLPDGASVRLQILNKNQELVQEIQQPSEKGFAVFILPADKDYLNSYIFKVEAMGLTKSVHAGEDQ